MKKFFERNKEFFVAFAATVTLLFLIMPLFLGPQPASDGSTGGAADAVTETDPGFFDGFEEVTANAGLDMAEADDVVHAGVCRTFVYMETADGGKYVCDDEDRAVRGCLQFKGVELSDLNNMGLHPGEAADESGAKSAGKAARTRTVLNMYLLVGVFILACLVGSVAKKRQQAKEMESRSGSMAVHQTAGTVSVAGQNTVPSDVPRVRFEDVEGIDELKQDVMRLVDCLKNPDKYRAIGARPPKGVILYGPPGTGKTLLAKAIAGEARVPFYFACGSDFTEKYVGVGAKRVRELYEKAKKSAPSIVFIDEIDALASKRGASDNSEHDQTLNAILTELDGFKDASGVITICATNRLDMLDDAFKRAGRFDLKLAVNLPDLKARINILKIHGRNKKFDGGVNLEQLAKRCVGFSGAELETLLNEAAMCAASRSSGVILNGDIDTAFFKIVMQGNRKPRMDMDEEARVCAWHEAGHALCTKLLTDDAVPFVTIMGSSSGAGGVTFRAPAEGRLQSRKYLESLIQVMYAGRAAEEIYFGNTDKVTIGAGQDIKQATALIREYLGRYGMGRKGMLDLSQFAPDFRAVLDEAAEMAHTMYENTVFLLKNHKNTLQRFAESLIENETLDEGQIDAIVKEACAA